MAQKKNEQRPKEGASVDDLGESKKVLAVDDDAVECELIGNLLEHKGYDVTACTDSHQAIDMIAAGEFDCILLDLHMNGLDGTELLPIIKHKFPELPVIIVSGFVDASNQRYYNSLGAFEVLGKPFSREHLLDALKRAVGVTETIPLVLDNLSLLDARDRVYRKLIVTALRRANWNQIKAAKLLGISRHCLMRWLKKLQITY